MALLLLPGSESISESESIVLVEYFAGSSPTANHFVQASSAWPQLSLQCLAIAICPAHVFDGRQIYIELLLSETHDITFDFDSDTDPHPDFLSPAISLSKPPGAGLIGQVLPCTPLPAFGKAETNRRELGSIKYGIPWGSQN